MKRTLKYLLLATAAIGLTAIGSASLLSAEETTEMKDMYPRLNSNVDGSPPACYPLKRAEAVWLTEQMDKGNIRTATPEDIDAWEDLAKKKNRPEQKIYLNRDCGRFYVILKPMVIDGLSDSQRLFIVPKGVPFPEVRTGNAVYDMNRGGAYQSGSYDDGEKSGYGLYPDDPSNERLQEESGKRSLDLLKKSMAK